ncbi:MAG: response regulator [Deltaproteobacteria bacterium]|nr:response regulator [Deltaproteobacteria bacterium]
MAHQYSIGGSEDRESSSPQFRVGFFVTDSGGLCFWASPELLELAKLNSDDLLGQFWFRILTEKYRKNAISQWESCIPQGLPFSFTGRGHHNRGKEALLLVECVVVPAQKDRPSHCVGVVIEAAGPTPQNNSSRLEEALKKIDSAERAQFDLSAALNVADSTINQLQSDLRKSADKQAALTKRVDELGKNILRTESELAQTCSAKFSLETQIVELKASHARIVDDQQKALVAVQNELEGKLAAKINEKRPLEEERNKLRQENEKSLARIKELEAQIPALSERIRALESSVEREKSKASALLAEKEKEFSLSRAESETQLRKMLGEATDLLNTKKLLTEKLAGMSRQIEKAEETEKTLLGRIQTLELGITSGQDTVKSQSAALEKSKAIEAELAAEKKKNQDALARLAELSEKLAAAQEEIHDGEQAIKAISRQSEEVDTLKAQFERELSESNKQRGILESEIKSLRETRERESAELRLQKTLAVDSQRALEGPTKALAHVGKHLSTLFQELFGFLQQLALTGENARAVARLKTAADYIAKLTSTVVDVLNLEHRQEKLAHEKINLKRLIAQLAGVFEFKASQQSIRFEAQVQSDIPDSVFGDAVRLEHALSTLIGNLLRLLPAEADMHLRIALQQETADTCTLDFAITCNDIDDVAVRQEICALAASTTAFASQNSNGLGFAMCRKVLDVMGSSLDVSEDESSLRMHFLLPFSTKEQAAQLEDTSITPERFDLPSTTSATPPPPAPEKAEPPAEPQSNARRLRVLLAEDNRINQNFITRVLKKQNYEVALAVNGREAAEMAEQQEFDLILMDCQMPQVDGYQATRNIRKFELTRNARSVIVGMSAHLDMDGRDRCINAGMDEYVSKPIQEDRLIELIRKLFE